MLVEGFGARCVGQVGKAGDRGHVGGGDPSAGVVVLVGGLEQCNRDPVAVVGVLAGLGECGQDERVLLGGEVHAEVAVDVGDVDECMHGSVEGVAVEPVDLRLVEFVECVERRPAALSTFARW